ncbi:four-carbon acid sugar kinase family protein [Vreelandella populi]|uniref:four-carbon acid sugar kinase family protein n=1 Tax=Vreelandella populi TaxID=2498858 RepID=UPI000F8C677C|nr:four-carbon acid sugar kinase family protein [Halomonas populi]RUR57215.1 four-carbon acid sugar kinase family protein [Halomonas populi]
MRYIFVADDFTGASDTLATLRRAGLKARLYLAAPSCEEVADLDAFGIATAARSMDQQALATEMQRIGHQLLLHQPDILHLKVCSTFDSSPATGNIATAITALSAQLKPATTLIVGGQPSLGRYCVFGNLFAKSADGQIYRIDRHPVMQQHPVTPMLEADLRRHFSAMGLANVNLLDGIALHTDDAAPSAPVLCDALDNHDLKRIGERFRHALKPQLWVGASSVVEALYPNPQAIEPPSSLPGPLLVFAGSRSSVTAAQVAATSNMTKVTISARQLANQSHAEYEQILRHLREGKATLAVLDEDTTHGLTALEIAQYSAKLIASLILSNSIGTLLIAGGDTSSLAIHHLQPQSIDYIGPLEAGVPVCAANFADGYQLPVIMKGGQMGSVTLFDKVCVLTCRND